MLFKALENLLTVIEIPILVLSIVFFSEVIAACLSNPKLAEEDNQEVTQTSIKIADLSLTVLVPARNEEFVISETVKDIKKQLRSQDQLIVIADNCTDQTAEVARLAGAAVIERDNLVFCGKGYALDYGIKALANNPPTVVVMIDADCSLDASAIFHLSQQALSTNLPAQAVYLFNRGRLSSISASISVLAIKIKNWVRPQGLLYYGFSCPLTGSGMAFPWQVISSVNLASGSIVEDMKLGLDLAIAGYPTKLCPQSRVYSTLPESPVISANQKTRWEHGHLRLLLEYIPKLAISAIKKKDPSLVAVMLDLAIPPLSLLVSIWGVLLLLSGTLSLLIGTNIEFTLPLKISGLSGGLLILSIMLSWLKFAREDISPVQLLLIPQYILRKLPVYLKFLHKPQEQWIKTARNISTRR